MNKFSFVLSTNMAAMETTYTYVGTIVQNLDQTNPRSRTVSFELIKTSAHYFYMYHAWNNNNKIVIVTTSKPEILYKFSNLQTLSGDCDESLFCWRICGEECKKLSKHDIRTARDIRGFVARATRPPPPPPPPEYRVRSFFPFFPADS